MTIVRKRSSLRMSALLFASLMLGCGGATMAPPSAPGAPPHGGKTVAFPDGKGFIEILNEAPGKLTKGKRPNTKITLFFLSPDLSASLKPTDVSLTLDLADGQKPVTVAPVADAKDPKKAGGFETPVGAYGGGGELAGTVTATIDGESKTIPFQVR